MLDQNILEKISNTLKIQLENKDIPEGFNEIFVNYVNEFTLRGGKRIRPALIYYTYILFRGEKLDQIMNVSTFIEYIQSWLLIHDDITDHDELRRGKATMHKEFEVIADKYSFEDKKDFGNTFAILAGDYSVLLALETLAHSDFEAEKIKSVLGWVAMELKNVVYGQNLDVITSKNPDYTQEDLINISDWKTARYTFTIPIVAGAIFAGAQDNDINKLMVYARNCGIAFQLRDDILGLFGKEEVTGKSNTGDIEEGKKTLLVCKALQNGDEIQREIIKKCLGNTNLTKTEADEFRRVIIDSGALGDVENVCAGYVNQAKEVLNEFPDHENEGWKFLNWIADYLLERDK